MAFWVGVALLIGGLIALLTAGDQGTIAGIDQGQFAGIILGMSLLILFMGNGLGYKGKMSKGVRDITIWLGLFFVLVLLYSFRNDFRDLGERIASELMPGSYTRGFTDQRGVAQVEIPKQKNGHFTTRVWINSVPIEVMIDTGATSVALTAEDAKKVGFPVDRLQYTLSVRTANGTAQTAPVKIKRISLNDITVGNVQAHVGRPGAMNKSLLGMSFLNRLRSYEVQNGTLILRR